MKFQPIHTFCHLQSQLVSIYFLFFYFNYCIVLCNGIWIDTGDLDSKLSSSFTSTLWSPIKLCPLGSVVVNGYYFEQLGLVDCKTGMSLQCAKWDSQLDTFVETEVITNGVVNKPHNLGVTEVAHDYAIGLFFDRWAESAYATEWQFIFKQQSQTSGHSQTTNSQLKCPEDWAICGFQIKIVQEENGGESVGFIKRIRFKCCYYCEPEEVEMIIRDISNFGMADITTQIKKIVGTQIEQGSHASSQKGQSIDQGREKIFSKNVQTSSNKMSNENVNTNFQNSLDNALNLNEGSSRTQVVGSNLGQTRSANEQSSFSTNLQLQDVSAFTRDRDTIDIANVAKTDTKSFGVAGYKMQSSDTSIGKQISGGSTFSRSTNIGISPGGSYETYTLGMNLVGTSTRDLQMNKQVNFLKNNHLEHQRSDHEDKQKSFNEGFEQDRHLGFQDTRTQIFSQGNEQENQLAFNQQIDKQNFHNFENNLQRNLEQGKHSGHNWGGIHGLDRMIQTGDQQVIQALFSAKFGQSSTSTVNWDNSESSHLNEGTEQTDSFSCLGFHRCIVKQIVGKCGQVEFYTPTLIKLSSPLMTPTNKMNILMNDRRQDLAKVTTDNLNTHQKLFHNNRPVSANQGEIWIIVVIPYNKTKIPSDIWETAQVCPLGSIVVGDRVKMDPTIGFTGWSLQCAQEIWFEGHHVDYVDVKTISSFVGKRGKWSQAYRANSSAIGFSFVQYTINGHQWSQGHRIEYQMDQNISSNVPMGASNIHNVKIQCPNGYALCGIQTMMDKQMESVTALGLKCCFDCRPLEKMVTIHQFKNSGKTMTSHSVKIWTGPLTFSGAAPSTNNGKSNGDMASIEAEIATEDARHIRARFLALSDSIKTYFTFVHDEEEDESGFNWHDSPILLWTTIEETALNFQCENNTKCVLKQLQGICGDRRFRTSFTAINNLSLPKSKNVTESTCLFNSNRNELDGFNKQDKHT